MDVDGNEEKPLQKRGRVATISDEIIINALSDLQLFNGDGSLKKELDTLKGTDFLIWDLACNAMIIVMIISNGILYT